MLGMQQQESIMSSHTLCENSQGNLDDGSCCLICCGALCNPATLHCGHSFCTECLQLYMSSYSRIISEAEGISISCPTCLENTQAPDDSLVALASTGDLGATQDALKKISLVGDNTIKCDVCAYKSVSEDCEYFCFKCQLHMCQACKNLHSQQSIFKGHTTIHISTKEVLSVHCDRHNNAMSQYFCIHCNEPACNVCVFHDHIGHHVTKLREALASHRETLRTVLNTLQNRIHQTEGLVDKIEGWIRKHLQRVIPEIAKDVDINDSTNDQTPLLHKSESSSDTPSSENRLHRRRSLNAHEHNNQGPSRKKSILPKFFTKGTKSPSMKRKNSVHNNNNSTSDTTKLVRRGSKEGTRALGLEMKEIPKPGSPHPELSRSMSDNPIRDQQKPTEDISNSLKKQNTLTANNTEDEEGNGRKTSEDSGYRKSSNDSNGSGGNHSPTVNSPDTVVQSLEHEMGLDIKSINFHLDTIRKVFDLAMKSTEMSQSRLLLILYDDILSRIDVILNTDIPQVYSVLISVIKREVTSVLTINHYRETSNSSSTDTGIYNKEESPGQSVQDSSSVMDMDDLDDQMCMLVKPELLWKVEKHKNDPGDLWNPSAVDFLPGGNVIVAEYDSNNDKNNRLRLFDNSGQQIGTIAQGKMRPLGLTVTREGHIAVTDCAGKRVKIFNPEGHQVAEWGKSMFGWPYGIAANSKGQFIVSDAFNDTISIHQPDGRKLKIFGGSGRHSRQFKNPYHLTVDNADNIIVSDCGNHCIKIFDAQGQLIRKSSHHNKHHESVFQSISKNAAGMRFQSTKTSLKSPRGLCVDPKGNILVADDRGRVCILNSEAKFERNLLTGEDSVHFAEDLAVNYRGQLAVTEWNPNNMFAIKVFGLYE